MNAINPITTKAGTINIALVVILINRHLKKPISIDQIKTVKNELKNIFNWSDASKSKISTPFDRSSPVTPPYEKNTPMIVVNITTFIILSFKDNVTSLLKKSSTNNQVINNNRIISNILTTFKISFYHGSNTKQVMNNLEKYLFNKKTNRTEAKSHPKCLVLLIHLIRVF